MIRFLILFSCITLMGQKLKADDIIHATSEDIAEFDQFLENDPIVQGKKEGPPPSKSQKPPRNSREAFNNQGQGRPPRDAGRGPRKGPPRDDRERGRRKPPPKPGAPPPGGQPPPPPPPN